VKDGHLAPFGRYDRQAAVGVAQYQHGLWLYLCQHAVYRSDEIANRVGGTGAALGTVQKIVWFAYAQVIEKNLVELVVVVLAGVHQNMFAVASSAASTRDKRMISGRVPTTDKTLSFSWGSHLARNSVGALAIKIFVGPEHYHHVGTACIGDVMRPPGMVSTTWGWLPLVRNSTSSWVSRCRKRNSASP